MTKRYSRQPKTEKFVKARGNEIRVHYKNTWETAKMLKGKTIKASMKYLNDVLDHKRCVPVIRYNSHVSRTGAASEFGVTQGRWPEKSVKIVMNILRNLEANANAKQLEVDKLVIRHVQVNRAQRGRRRTYRAHGRITPFMSSPCHIEMWAEVPSQDVPKAEKKSRVMSLVRQAKRKVKKFVTVGGDKQ